VSTRFRTLVTLPAVLLLAVGAGGCGSDDSSSDDSSGSGDAKSTPAPTETGTTEDTDTTAETDDSASGGGGGTELKAEVGENDSFEISLKQGDAAVTSLKPGKYTIKVEDYSAIHNFHLTGPGVDETTDVGAKENKTWTVELKAGTYNYVCDPHASSMKGSFTVA
jgi:plastocyanin